jgi:hypothetical protein
MRKLFLFLSFSLLAYLPFAQTIVHTDHASTRTVGSFHGVSVSAGIQVQLTKDAKEAVVVTADKKEAADNIKTEVADGILRIYRDDTWKFWKTFHGNIKVYVSYKQIDALKASSGSSITSDDLKTEKLTAEASSGAEINLTGSADELTVDCSSGSSFKGYDFVAKNCKARASSGAGIKLTVKNELSAHASSGGEIKYKGEGLMRDINVSSGGEVKHAK